MGPRPVKVTIEEDTLNVDVDQDFAFVTNSWVERMNRELLVVMNQDLDDQTLISELEKVAQVIQMEAWECGELIYSPEDIEEIEKRNPNFYPPNSTIN